MKINKIGNRVPEIISQTGIVFIGVSLYSVCNLFYHFIMVRMLSPIDYGHLNTLFALFMIISVPANTLQTATTHFVSTFLAHQLFEKIKSFLRHLLIVMTIIASSVFFLILLATPLFSSYLKLDSWNLIILLAISLFFGFIVPVPWGGLQGLQRFGSFSANLILNGGLKVLLGFLFVYIGFGAEGAMGAIGVAYFITTFSSLLILWCNLMDNPHSASIAKDTSMFQNDSLSLKDVYIYFLPTGITLFCFLTLTNIDLIYVKYFFTPLEAGFYSIAQMVGKIVLFLPLPIVMVMFPKFTSYKALGKNFTHLLNQSLATAGILCGGALLFCFLFPSEVIWILTGKTSQECLPLVRFFSLNMTFFSITFVLLYYHLAMRSKTFLYVLITFTLIQVGLITLFHRSLIQILTMVSMVAFFLLAINLFMIYIKPINKKRNNNENRNVL